MVSLGYNKPIQTLLMMIKLNNYIVIPKKNITFVGV